jgi:hypothetical protein
MQYFPWVGSVRSIATLLIVGTFCFLAIKGTVDAKDFVTVVTVVVAFYFVTKKREDAPVPEEPPEVK